MSTIEDFGQTENVKITVLVDNQASLLVRSTEMVKRFTREPLLAEHGFAALVELEDAGLTVLWDAGMTRTALLENARLMDIDLSAVDKIALSHGHGDHYAAMTDVIRAIAAPPGAREWGPEATLDEIRDWVRGRRVPLVAHPVAFRERWGLDEEGGKKYGPHLAPRAEWQAAGAAIALSEGPYQLGPGCWTTGAVPRLSFEQAGTPAHRAYREGDAFKRDYLDDDQSIVINVKDKGLVVLTGCAHAGVVNTVHHAREISGVDRVWAVLGGFHLAPAKDDEIDRTINEIAKLKPHMVAPTHCTGFQAMARFAQRMPDEFVLGVVGTTYLF
jgi:7,8-dihydropterin-6-yl-methyl-4-(beta-D-ribofuranosyl)aminobenzene 5'-phosphate synthase